MFRLLPWRKPPLSRSLACPATVRHCALLPPLCKLGDFGNVFRTISLFLRTLDGRAGINVQCRRTGGGFGGKLTRDIPLSAAAALGAYVTGKTVHVQLDRCQDSIMVLSLCGGLRAVLAWQ